MRSRNNSFGTWAGASKACKHTVNNILLHILLKVWFLENLRCCLAQMYVQAMRREAIYCKVRGIADQKLLQLNYESIYDILLETILS